MTPGIALWVIGGILLVAGWKNQNIVDVALGRGTKRSGGSVPVPAQDSTAVPQAPGISGRDSFPLPAGSYVPSGWTKDQGVDISAPGHTPLQAIGDGTIIGHGINGFGAWAPILKLDTGDEVYYGHAGPGHMVKTGTRVRAGQVIGEVGAGIVGISTGPHLEIGYSQNKNPLGGSTAQRMLDFLKGKGH